MAGIRKKHPHKVIEQSLRYAEEKGWTITVGGSHAWGKIYCPFNDSECRCGEFCINSIWSTPRNPETQKPRNPENHAKQIKRVIDNCTGTENDN